MHVIAKRALCMSKRAVMRESACASVLKVFRTGSLKLFTQLHAHTHCQPASSLMQPCNLLFASPCNETLASVVICIMQIMQVLAFLAGYDVVHQRHAD